MNASAYQLQLGAESGDSPLRYCAYSLLMEDVSIAWRLQCDVIKGDVISLSLEPTIDPCSLNRTMVLQVRH